MNYYGGDSAVFILMGKMFIAGKIPYVDFFEHKGPTLLFIEAIGLKLADNERSSIFILQVINLFITQIFIYKIAKTYLPHFISIGIVMLTLLAFSFTIQGGNSTEEWSLPYLYLCLLITLRFNDYSIRGQKICFVIMGMSATILFWMRLNNMGIICACLIFIMIIALQNKNLKLFLNLALGGLLGFFFVSIPIIIYFTHIGALSEMIYASFLFNFSYIQYNLEQSFSLVDLIKGWLSLLTLIIGSILYYKKYRDYKMLVLCICLFLLAFVTTHIGPQYFHYMTLNLPLFSIGVIQIFCTQKVRLLNRNSNLVILTVAFFMLFGYIFYKKNQKQYIKDQDDTLFIHNSTDIVDKIPVNERPFIFAYNVSARFWLITNILPGYKFFTNQEWHGLHDKSILTETNRLIQEIPPLWIVIPNDNANIKFINTELSNILFEEYQESYRNNDLILMRRITSN